MLQITGRMEVLKTIEEVFAKNLKDFRGSLSQADLAERANIPFRTYQNMEAGIIPSKKENLSAVAKLHQVPETRFFLDPDLIDVKPTVQQALKVIQDYVEITGNIVKKDSWVTGEIADFSEDEKGMLKTSIEAIKATRALAGKKSSASAPGALNKHKKLG